MDRTKIEWTRDPETDRPGASWNPIRARNRDTGKIGWFCTHASDGCTHCYAETLNHRFGTGIDYRAQDLAKVEIFLDEKMLKQPLRWRRPRRIFVGSMTDLFGEFVPDAMLDRIFALMVLAPQHTFLLLTKRAGRMRDYLYGKKLQLQVRWGTAARQIDPRAAQKINLPFPLPQISLGVSVEDQRRADERIPELLATPAAVRWVSAEPLLEHIALGQRVALARHPLPRIGIDWVVTGGESGPSARPLHPAWVRSLRDQCTAAGVPFFFKQWGEWIDADEWFDGLTAAMLFDGKPWLPLRPLNFSDARTLARICGRDHYEKHSDGTTMIRVGKRAAGRLLDGRLWDEYPERGDA